MRKAVVSVDFSKRVKGNIKPLHGVNNSPMSLYEPPLGFKEAGIPYCRLHDTGGAFGGTRYVDIPNVFPDFDADPKKPESYDFAFTDAYLKQLHAAGTKIFYRLGVTIENNYRIKGYHNCPPKDFKKWSEICAGIVRHYNCGWANGFRFGIKYWEIWNEPENPPMWSGSMEQYFELYRITSKRLKKEFPEIKVGGYASCGFYVQTREDKLSSAFYKSFDTWFHSFLKYVTAKKTACPLDFYSWHLYTLNPEEIALHGKYVAGQLKKHKLDHVESIFNEWNYVGRGFATMKKAEGACFVAGAFCLMQDAPVDKAMYYDAYPQRAYGGLYYFPDISTTRTYSVFYMWNRLFRLGKRCAVTVKNPDDTPYVYVGQPGYSQEKLRTLPDRVYACAAASEKGRALFLTNCGKDSCRVTLDLNGAKLSDFTGYLVDDKHDREPVALKKEMNLAPFSVLLLTEKDDAGGKSLKAKDFSATAGLDDSASKKKKAKKS